MLYGSLFYAKLYLSLLIFNMITHLDKSQDTRINYVKQSGIDKDIINKTEKTLLLKDILQIN